MVCHIFSDMAKVPDTDTAEETMESLDDPDRADENGAPEAHHSREDLLPEFTDHDILQTMVQTINNPDGTPQVVTLADGTHAQVVHATQWARILGNIW